MKRFFVALIMVGLLSVGLTVLALQTAMDRTYGRGQPPWGMNLAKFAGLPPGTGYEMIYGRSSGLDPHGDRIEYYCLQLDADPWVVIDTDDWRLGPFEDDPVLLAASVGKIAECFGTPDARTGAAHIAYRSSGNRMDSVQATFVSMTTGRVLAVGFAN